MKFAYKLQELRKGCGMSQEEFAELLGVSRQSVSKWESGKGYPEIDKLIFISNYFNTSLDLLLKDTQESSVPVSTKSTRVSKKKKGSIKLTKPQDIPLSQNEPKYISDPTPSKRTENLSLRRVSVSPDAQIRPIKSHQFGFDTKKRKLSTKGKVSLILTSCIVGIVSSVSIIVIGINDNHYSNDEAFQEVTTVMDLDGVSYYDTDNDWVNLYDNDVTSSIEEEMANDINNQTQCILIDKDNNVYYSGDNVVSSYINAQWNMKNALNDVTLYQRYITLKSKGNYVEVYSWDYEQWVIINKSMLRVYSSSSGNLPYEVPSITYDFSDILSNELITYMGYSTSPFEKVYMISKQSYANVSSEILDMCISAMEDRKLSLTMEEYITMYEELNSKCQLIECTERGTITTFVPKEFIMVSVSDLENDVNEQESIIIEDNAQVVKEDNQVENVE
ncbi:MAG: helix-turn-helix domain-containing protein [Oscillospiraceae bacterium]